MTDPLIIEARLNEDQPRDASPHIPLGPDEIVRDAVRCEEAGAAMVHWHVRDERTGATVEDESAHRETFRDTVRELRSHTRLILSPTRHSIAQFDRTDAIDVDADLVPVTFGAVNTGTFPQDELRAHTRADTERLLEFLRSREIGVTAVCWDLGQIRTARAYAQLGSVEPALWQFVFSGPSVPGGPAPELQTLQALVACLPEHARWLVSGAYGVDILPIAAHAVALGGHVSIGLGDHPYERFGFPDNAAVVARLVQLAETIGRPVAMPDQARRSLGLRSRAAGVPDAEQQPERA